jgi:zinc-ribbon domain
MFCPKCGTQLPDGSAACSSCGTTFAAPRAGAAAAVAGERMKSASTDALGAFKTFATNPVGGLADAYHSLGPAKALGVGLTFGIVFAVCILLSVYRIVPEFMRPTGVGGFFKLVIVAIVPFGALFVAAAAVRTIFRGEGALGSDSFLAGAALLPFGLIALIMTILGPSNLNIMYFLAIFTGSLSILMLWAGLTRIYKISERLATLAVPIMIVVTGWLSKLIYRMMMESAMGGGGMGGGNPFEGM